MRDLQKAVEIDAHRQRGRGRFFQKGAQKRHEILLFRAVTPQLQNLYYHSRRDLSSIP